MVLARASYKIVSVLFLALLASHAQAAEALKPMRFNGRYTIAWSGITLGRILIRAHEDETSYRMSIDTKTKGIGALISDEKRIVEAEGKKNDIGVYIPVRYNARPQKEGDEDEDEVTLTYDAEGNIVSRTRKNDDNPAWRPPVPNVEINTARDPITATFMLRRALYDAVLNNRSEVSTRTYDGLRLAEMKLIRSQDKTRIELMGDYKPVVNVAIKRIPVNGYTPKELKKYRKGDPEIRIYFTQDADFLPVRASARTAIGELSMTLQKFE